MPVVRTLLAFALWLPAALISMPARAEDSDSADLTDQLLQSSTDLYVDILQAGETIRWQGNGSVTVFTPTGQNVGTLNNNQSHTTTMTGEYWLNVGSNQQSSGNGIYWDVTVFRSGVAQTGRLHSYSWEFFTGTFGASRSFDGSFYALVPAGLAGNDGVIEFKTDGWSGNEWELSANPVGVAGANGRSVPTDGNDFEPEYPIYLNPPAIANYQVAQPEIVGQLYGAGINDCGYAVPGVLTGEFTFESNVEGTFHIVCDINRDGLFDITSDDDVHIIGNAIVGINTANWDGLDNSGDPILGGVYDCKVILTVGEFHYGARDVETSYEGFRLFKLDAGLGRTELPMFWNDEGVAAGDVNMPAPTSVPGLPTSGPGGIWSGSYTAPAVPNVNARSWGDFGGNHGKGNDVFMDTYTYLDADVTTTMSVFIDDGTMDSDGDGLPDWLEDCETETSPIDRDTDDDGLTDDEEVLDYGTDPNNPDTDGDGIQDGTELGVTFPVDSDTDLDGFIPDDDPTTTTDPLDDDSDDDGILDGNEDTNHNGLVDPGETDPNDADSDDDGIQDGTESGLAAPQGDDTDLDEFVPDADPTTTTDPLDDDSDDDGLLDGTEDADHDGAWTGHVGNPGDQGTGETDPGLADTDGDGIQDGTELGLTEAEGDDTDEDVFQPDNDPSTTTDPLDPDTDDGGVSDGNEDLDHDGEMDPNEGDPLDPIDDPWFADCDRDGLSDAYEIQIGTQPCDADTDDDGITDGDEVNGTGPLDDWAPTDPLDPDTDDDGLLDGTEVGVTDENAHPDTDQSVFIGDDDPSTETDPNSADSDSDGLEDGEEDANHDGSVDEHEPDPNDTDTDDDGFDDWFEVDVGLDPTLPGIGQGGAAGACNAVGVPAGPWALLFAMAVPLLRRRRGFAVALGTLAAGTAAAQDGPNIDIQRFDPSPQPATFTRLRDAEQARGGSFGAFASLNYSYHPFEIGDPETGERQIGIVDHLFGVDIGAEVAPTDWLAVGLTMPVMQVAGLSDVAERIAAEMGGTSKHVGIGDLQVQVGLSPVRQSAGQPLNVAVVPRFTLPTGSTGMFLGTGVPSVGADVAVGRRWDPVRFSSVVGYEWVPQSEASYGVYHDDELRYGVGVGVPVGHDVEIEGEWAGAFTVTAAGKQALGDDWSAAAHSPMELTFAGLWKPEPLWLKFGTAAGLTRGFGTSDFRVFVQGGFLVNWRDGSEDRDFDGIVDRRDACRDDPEDIDQWQDDDGCPDVDNDGDGIYDSEDGPVLAATYESWTTAPPQFGACMNDAEDVDGFEDADGCPEPDNDGDGILDVVDGARTPDGAIVFNETYPGIGNCADQAEVLNGVDDTDGCPDTAKARLDWKINEIVVLETIYFKFDKWEIDEQSFPVMEAVKTVLDTYPNITKVEIQGHTDEQGPESYNDTLSQKRVDSVRTWLVAHGIAEDRLVAVGYGESAPIVPGARTQADHAKNRRVQFVIIERSGPAPEAKIPGATLPPAPGEATPAPSETPPGSGGTP